MTQNFDLHGTPPGPKNEQDYPNLWDLDLAVCQDEEERFRRTIANGFAIGMIQADREALAAARFVRDVIRPRNVMELGTCCGGWLYVLDGMKANIEHRTSNIEPRNGLTVSVDRPWFEREPKPKWGPEMLRRELPHLIEVTGDIHAGESFRAVQKIQDAHNFKHRLGPAAPFLDLLFIDADHSYEGTRRHWEMYRPLVKPGGWVGFHDIANGWGCQRFWEELIRTGWRAAGSPRVNWQQFVAAPPSSVFGIGFIQV